MSLSKSFQVLNNLKLESQRFLSQNSLKTPKNSEISLSPGLTGFALSQVKNRETSMEINSGSTIESSSSLKKSETVEQISKKASPFQKKKESFKEKCKILPFSGCCKAKSCKNLGYGDLGEGFEQKYELLEVLGKGHQGSVVKAKHLPTNKLLALKFLHEKDDELSQNLQNEYELLESLSHPNIISVKELIFLETSSVSPFVMVMEYLENYIPLQSFIETPLLSQQILCIFSQICSAVCYLHESRIAHRDLHISNVLIHPETLQIKLIDFGLAKKQANYSKSLGSFPLIRLQQDCFELNTPTGIPCFRAPEVLKQNFEGDSLKADVWMLGLLLLALSTGEYLTTATILKRFQEFDSGTCREFEEKITKILRATLRKDPAKRFSAKNLLDLVEKA